MDKFMCLLTLTVCHGFLIGVAVADPDNADDDVAKLCKRYHGKDASPSLDAQCIYVCKDPNGGEYYENKRNGFICADNMKCLAAQCYNSYLVDACMQMYPMGGDNLTIIMGMDGCSAKCENMDVSQPLTVHDGDACVAMGICQGGKCSTPDPDPSQNENSAEPQDTTTTTTTTMKP